MDNKSTFAIRIIKTVPLLGNSEYKKIKPCKALSTVLDVSNCHHDLLQFRLETLFNCLLSSLPRSGNLTLYFKFTSSWKLR